MFNKKRGLGKRAIIENPLFFLSDLIFLIVIFIIMMAYVDRVAESTLFEKTFLARDLGLLIDTLYASPGTTIIDYPQETFWFTFNFQQNKVEVYEESNIPLSHPSSYYMQDKNIKLIHKELKPQNKIKEPFIKKYFMPLSYFYTSKPKKEPGTYVTFSLAKVNNKLVINEKQQPIDPRLLNCESVITQKSGSPPIISWLVDDPHSLNKDLLNKITRSYISVITFAGNNPDTSTNNIKAYVPLGAKTSKQLACMIINNILQNENLQYIMINNNLQQITGVSVIPSEKYTLLEKGEGVVLIEIGNKNIDKEQNILSNPNAAHQIQESINRAIESMLQ